MEDLAAATSGPAAARLQAKKHRVGTACVVRSSCPICTRLDLQAYVFLFGSLVVPLLFKRFKGHCLRCMHALQHAACWADHGVTVSHACSWTAMMTLQKHTNLKLPPQQMLQRTQTRLKMMWRWAAPMKTLMRTFRARTFLRLTTQCSRNRAHWVVWWRDRRPGLP